MENISPVLIWFLVFFIGFMSLLILSILFPKRFYDEQITSKQTRAINRQNKSLSIVIWAFLFMWAVSWIWDRLYPDTTMPLTSEISRCFWILALFVGLYIGFSAIFNRVIVFTAKGSREHPSGSCAVVEGVAIIIVIILAIWFCGSYI